jgi:hypothetical protein
MVVAAAMAQLAFWGFIAVVVVAGVWREVATRRESEMTIRLAIEKGQQLDPATIDKLLGPNRKRRSADGLMVAGGVTLATGLGLPIMGYFIGRGGDADAFYPLLGVGSLVSLIGVALLVLSVILRSRQAQAGQGIS